MLSYQPYSLYILKTACSLVTSSCCSLCTRYPSNGWQASVTTAFDIRVKLSTGGSRHIEQRNEWLFVHIVAVYWVYCPC